MQKKDNKPEYNKLFVDLPVIVNKYFSLWVADNNRQKARHSVIIKKKKLIKQQQGTKSKE